MQVAPTLKPQPGDKILDLCAAPGGKATHLAELMNNQGLIVACDLTRRKLEAIEQNTERLGIDIIQPVRADDFDSVIASHGPFDAALVDAPCSNTGVLARRVEARHLLKPAQLNRNAETQLELLQRAIESVKSGGRILYSTCSIDPMENEQLIEKLMQLRDDLECIESRLTLPQAAPIPADLIPANLPDNAITYTWNDGGYFALLHKR